MSTKEILRLILLTAVMILGTMGMVYIFWNVYMTNNMVEKVFMITLAVLWPFLCIALVARLTKVRK